MGVPNLLPTALPCQCTNPSCGYSFIAPNPIGGGGMNIQVTNISTNCPRCGGVAKYPDWHTDSNGRFHLDKIFDQVSKIKDPNKLRLVKDDLEAANEDFTAEDLADTLIQLDPGFAKYKEAIKSLPASTIVTFVNMLFAFITVMLTWQSVAISRESLDSSQQLQQQQYELSREQFEYQKRKDEQAARERESSESRREQLEKEMEAMKSEFEQRLRDIENQEKPLKPRPLLKASLRNKPCPCGSGKKAKKCHPRGIA